MLKVKTIWIKCGNNAVVVVIIGIVVFNMNSAVMVLENCIELIMRLLILLNSQYVFSINWVFI
jgi:hypothetical protein